MLKSFALRGDRHPEIDDMADSTLLHDDATPPTTQKGHGTAALGPSDSSDTGSDIQGGPGLNRDDGLMEPPGTTSDPDVDGIGATAGSDIGDANLDSDSDRNGTGERAAAGRDSTLPTDTILRGEHDEVIDPESIGDEVDNPGPALDEVVGSGVDREEADSARADANIPDVSPSRIAGAGQQAKEPLPSGTRRSDEVEPGERQHARADGKRVTGKDDVPVFDRGGRTDLPKRR